MNTLTTKSGIAQILGANLNLTYPILIVKSNSMVVTKILMIARRGDRARLKKRNIT